MKIIISVLRGLCFFLRKSSEQNESGDIIFWYLAHKALKLMTEGHIESNSLDNFSIYKINLKWLAVDYVRLNNNLINCAYFIILELDGNLEDSSNSP